MKAAIVPIRATPAEVDAAEQHVRDTWGVRASLVESDAGYEVVYRLLAGDTPHRAFLDAEMDSGNMLSLSLAELHTLLGENTTGPREKAERMFARRHRSKRGARRG